MINAGFIITEDLIDTNSVGTTGPFYISPLIEAKLKEGEGTAFELFDDDGELYYRGLVINPDELVDSGYDPLYAFGMPYAGCTSMTLNGEPYV